MVIASIVLGILLIIGGVSCMGAPVETYLRVAHLLAVLLFVYGVFGILRFFKRRALIPEFVISILAVLIAFVYLFRPGGTPPVGNLIGLDRFVLTVIALWFLIKGCVTFSLSIKTRFVNRRWIWGFFSGLLSIILGIYSLSQPAFAAATTGTLVGLFFVQCGIDLLVFGTAAGLITGAVKQAENNIAGTVEEVRAAARSASDELRAEAEAAEAAARESAEDPDDAEAEDTAGDPAEKAEKPE